jgi:hypothetical protein
MDYQTRLQCERRRLLLLFDNTARHVNHVRIRVSGEFRSSQQKAARSGPWGHRKGEPTTAVTKCCWSVAPKVLLSLRREATFFSRRHCLVLTSRLLLFFHVMHHLDWSRTARTTLLFLPGIVSRTFYCCQVG